MKSSSKKLNFILKIFMAVTAVLIGLILIGGWYDVMNKSTILAKTRTKSEALNEQQNALSNLEIGYQKILPDKNLIFDSIPSDKNVSSFIADIDGVAGRDSLTVTETDIGSQTTTQLSTTTQRTTNMNLSQTTAVSGYYELPIKVVFHGSYTNFIKAIGDLGNLRRETTIVDITVAKSSADGSDQTDLVDATVDLLIYIKP